MEDKLYRLTRKTDYEKCKHDAIRIIKKAINLNKKNIAVAISGGKDSVVLSHIVSLYCKPYLLFTDSGLEHPESEVVVNKLSETLGLKKISIKADAIGWLEKYGRKASESLRIDSECIEKPTKKLINEYDIGLEFVGLREEESKKRKILIKTNGPVFKNKKWNCITAYPLRKWTARDVFAYIDEYNLPLHPAYTRTNWRDRDKIRVSWVWDIDFENSGSVEYIRKFYPNIFNKLRNIGILEG